jgi:4-amino-4-deoxychorismate lyase
VPDEPDASPASKRVSLLVGDRAQLLDREAPLLRADDLGVLRGDGVFESLLVVGGEPDDLDEHIERLQQSAGMLGLEVPPAHEWLSRVATAIGAWSGGPEMVVRLVVTRGTEGAGPPTSYLLADEVGAKPLSQRSSGLAVLALPAGRVGDPVAAPWLLLGAKTLSYSVNMSAIRYAESQGADDAIFLSGDDRVLEGPTSSVLMAGQGWLLSPPPAAGILRGITVSHVLERSRSEGWSTEYRELRLSDLFEADGVWLISSIRRAAPVNSIDGRRLECDPELRARIASLANPGGAE